MYGKNKPSKATVKGNETYEGETIEAKVRRIVNNKEKITDGAPLIYTERKDGIQAAYDIRTDRFEIAVEAMEKVQQTKTAKRELATGEKTYDTMNETQQQEFNKKYPSNKYAQAIKQQQNNNQPS